MFLAAVAYVVLVTGSVSASEITHTTAQLSEARYRIGATTVGELAIFAGGGTASGKSSTVDIYNSDTRTWLAPTQDLTEARSHIAATTLGNKAFFAGGINNNLLGSTVVDIYDYGTGEWTSIPDALSIGRGCFAATTVGNLAIFGGGETGTGYSDVVDIYDEDKGSPTDLWAWSTTSLSQARRFVSATTAGNKAFFAGGEGPYSAVVDIYDALTDSWSVDALPGGARDDLAAVTLGNRAFFCRWCIRWCS